MAKKSKKANEQEFAETKKLDLDGILERRKEIEDKIRELKKERKELMQEEGRLKTLLNTIGGDK